MTEPNYIGFCFWIVSLSQFASGAIACEAPAILSPVSGAHVNAPHPNIVWSPVPAATSYEIEVLSRVPEGEVLARQQSSTAATAYQPTQPLAQDKAVVVATLTARCGDKRSAPVERRFNIDLAGLCAKPDGLNPTQIGRFLRLEWKKLQETEEIEGRIFAGLEAKPGETATTHRGPLLIPLPEGPPWVAGVRQRCRIGISDWVWLRESDLPRQANAAASSR